MLVDMEGNELKEPHNGLYLKQYYAWYRCVDVVYYNVLYHVWIFILIPFGVVSA